MAQKSLDQKIANILANPSGNDFILADAKDADMGFGMAAPGEARDEPGANGEFRTLAQYRSQMRANVAQGLIDIMLMSASTSEQLTLKERLFDDSHITPAVRANDTTDIWLASGSSYREEPSRPFRSASIDHAMAGHLDPTIDERQRGANLGLYSMTFNNDLGHDHASLEAYAAFRLEAERKGFRHFLEVFDPNAAKHPLADLGRYVNDCIARALAGVCGAGRPLFLKIAYHGPAAMEQLVSYDPTLVVGILGGSSGTTFDAFHQLAEAKRYGARCALYGRMINNSEHQPTFIQHLRWLADGELTDPTEATRSYHAALETLDIRPDRPIEDDLVQTRRYSSYG